MRPEELRLFPSVHTDEVIDRLYQFGYFFCPEVWQSYGELKPERIAKFTRDDTAVKIAVKKYQSMFKPQLDEAVRRLHFTSRESVCDGEASLGTEFILTKMDRCGYPDFEKRFRINADEPLEARFGDACRNRITTSHRLRLRGLTDQQIANVWSLAGTHWSDRLDLDFVLEQDKYPRTHQYAFMANLGGNVLADQMLTNGSCSATLRGRFDSGRSWTFRLAVPTAAHERGHTLGWGHENRDREALMYPIIHEAGMRRGGTPNETDIRNMERIGYRRRDKPPIPEDPQERTTFGQFVATTDIKKGTKVFLVSKHGNNNNDDDGGTVF